MIEAYDVIVDNRGVLFSPRSCNHSYTYDANGNLQTDSCTDIYSITRVQTYTFVNNALTTVSKWVQQ